MNNVVATVLTLALVWCTDPTLAASSGRTDLRAPLRHETSAQATTDVGGGARGLKPEEPPGENKPHEASQPDSVVAGDLVSDAGVHGDYREFDSAGRPSPRAHRRVLYVIVTDRSLAPEFHRLAMAHTRRGLHTIVHTLQAIRASYPGGRDDAERIRMFLKDAYASWDTRWLLLGGDDPLIPMRRAFIFLDTYSTLLPTDQYYACLNGTWNADADTLWGELPDPRRNERGDGVDMIPELNVGRAPVTTRAEARRFVDKTLEALEPPQTPSSSTALVAASLGTGPSDGIDFASLTRHVVSMLDSIPEMHVARLYQNFAHWPGAFPESRRALLDSLERGYDLAIIAGPGGGGLQVAGPHPAEDVLVGDLLGLTNARLSQVYILSAFTNAPYYPNIGQALMRARGGAVSVIGSTNVQFSGFAGRFMDEFFRQAYTLGAGTVGEALKRAITTLSPNEARPGWDDFRVTTQGNVLLGDPALPLAGAVATPVAARSGAARSDEEAVPRSHPGWEMHVTPNPATTTLYLELIPPTGAAVADLDVAIFDAAGRRVAALRPERPRGRTFSMPWNLTDASGVRVPDGLYFARVTAGVESRVLRVIVLR